MKQFIGGLLLAIPHLACAWYIVMRFVEAFK